jgi:3,4-dihydroxy 2-butanone 4-phosphate synthase / GTP cyclohydrolase II
MPSRSGPEPDGTVQDSGFALVTRTVLPTEAGQFVVHAYLDPASRTECLALVMGDVTDPDSPPLVRLHSECLTGDALGSYRCDCGDQLRAAQLAIGHHGRGIVIYLRGHEGRGIGLSAKLQAYNLQDGGMDTVDANLALGYDADLRSYDAAAAVLTDLGVRRIRLLSANPEKEQELVRYGIEVTERVVLPVPSRVENLRYLETKRARMGHALPGTIGDPWTALTSGRVPMGVLDPPDAELVSRYAPLVTAGPRLVLAQLGQSLDGFIAARTGDAQFVTSDEDREHLHRLRALVDAVVVGVGTLIADDCRLTVRAVPGRSPVRVLLDPSARAPRTASMFHDGDTPVLWCVADHLPPPEPPAAHVEVVRLAAEDGLFPPAGVLALLADRGLCRVLVEGGGRTVSAFLAAQVLDRIFLTTAPLLIGDGVPGLRFTGTPKLSDALRAPARRFMLGPDVCFELDLASLRDVEDDACPA